MTEVEKIIEKCREEIERITGIHVDIKVIEKEVPITLQKIASIVMDVCEVSEPEFKSKRRTKNLVFARSLYCFYAKKHTHFSLREMGLLIGSRDHTTIMYNIARVKDFVSIKDEVFAYYMAIIETRIKHIGYLKEIDKFKQAS